MTAASKQAVRWTQRFILIDGRTPARQAMISIAAANVRRRRSAPRRARLRPRRNEWIVIRSSGRRFYVLALQELLDRVRAAGDQRGARWFTHPLESALALRTEDASIKVASRVRAAELRDAGGLELAPSATRYVLVRKRGIPEAVGFLPKERRIERETDVVRSSLDLERALTRALELEGTEWLGASSEAPGTEAVAASYDEIAGRVPTADVADAGLERAQAPRRRRRPPPAKLLEAEVPEGDEGTSPIRYPSIDAKTPMVPGAEVTIVVDLTRAKSAHTQGEPVGVRALPSDWETLDLAVVLACPFIDFQEDGQRIVQIRRNADSIPVRVKGRISRKVAAGTPLVIMAHFFDRTRYCGSGLREFVVAAPKMGAAAKEPGGETPVSGVVLVEPGAEAPDLTVHIVSFPGSPRSLRWLLVVARFDALPASLQEDIDLGAEPSAFIDGLFGEFATLERGSHEKPIEGFGTRLWKAAPQAFRATYWAMWDRYRRELTIQFITDEPHVPWELMRPERNENEVHPPLALKHPVARWITRWDGYMRSRLPGGRIFTIAPKYASPSRRLPRAQTEAADLVESFGAQVVAGTTTAVMALLEARPPPEQIGVLHFAGHGSFSAHVATASKINLEDGPLTAAEIERPEVQLGRACRTLVFLNACETGSTSIVLGQVGGWADAFLGRQFGGFIAPLWAVDDKDAGIVAKELLAGVLTEAEGKG